MAWRGIDNFIALNTPRFLLLLICDLCLCYSALVVEQGKYRLNAYRDLVYRSSLAAFYASFGVRFKSLAYVAELASVAARNDARAIGLTHAECENAYRIGFFRGDQGADEADQDDLAGLDAQEAELTEILEESLNLTAPPVIF